MRRLSTSRRDPYAARMAGVLPSRRSCALGSAPGGDNASSRGASAKAWCMAGTVIVARVEVARARAGRRWIRNRRAARLGPRRSLRRESPLRAGFYASFGPRVEIRVQRFARRGASALRASTTTCATGQPSRGGWSHRPRTRRGRGGGSSSTPPSSPPSTSDVVSGRHRRGADDRPGRRVTTSGRRDRPGGLDGVREAGSAAEGDGGRTARALAIGDARGGMGTTTTLDASRTPRLSSSEVTTREETSSLAFPSPPRRARRRSTRR